MPSGEKRVPALVLCFSGAGRVGAGGRVVVPSELVVARCTGVSVGDAPAVKGAESPYDPAVFDCILEKFDCILEKFDGIMVGDDGAGGVT